MTKEEILEAAADIIRQKGFHATSMQDIARAVDLRKASLYHHVSSKQEILVDLLDQALDLLISELENVLEKDIPADKKFRLALNSYLNILADNQGLSAVLLLEHRSLEPEYRDRHLPRRDKYEGLWLSIIEQGKQEGIFQIADEKIAIKAVLGMANWTIMWMDPVGRLSPTEIADLYAGLLLDGFNIRDNITL